MVKISQRNIKINKVTAISTSNADAIAIDSTLQPFGGSYLASQGGFLVPQQQTVSAYSSGGIGNVKQWLPNFYEHFTASELVKKETDDSEKALKRWLKYHR